ncbi:thioredoxin family protein [Roseiconus nitratireducens]|uniref:Thioredoxin family protein n=1 Tax=Roseiconus nitratireducens TaxID=2605748 RepID=A0A5M6DD38_9BACT|nr:thioredoxin family protein [Roseiconus nitratireducens]KAA5544320.1 thioredoxin family protein [Roseiconus nitratireducens]
MPRPILPLLLAFLACWTALPSHAGKYNSVLDIGDPAPAWKELPGTDGQVHSLASLSDAKAVVVVFTCNSCPYALDAEDRLIALTKEYADRGVAVVAINVNTVEEDRMPAMKERAEEKQFPYPYLWDESQQIAKQYGAKFTPQFFVLGRDRQVVYMGSLDDSPGGDAVTKTYVADAIESVLSGDELAVTETVPIGCTIRFERERRKRGR